MDGRRQGPGCSRRSGRPGPSGWSGPDREPAHAIRLGRAADPLRALRQQFLPGEAGVPGATVRVQDPYLGGSTRRPEPVARHANLRPLADHVPPQPDPRPPAELQPQGRYLAQRAGESRWQARRLEHDQLDPGPAGEGRQSAEPFGQGRGRDAGAVERPVRQVEQQEIDRSVLEQHRRHGHRLGERIGREDDEPFQPHPARDRLDRVEAPGQVQVCDKSAGGLGMGGGLQRQRGLATGPVPVECSGRSAWQAAKPKDRVQGGETGGDGPLVEMLDGPPDRLRGLRLVLDPSRRIDRQGSDHLRPPARGCASPALPEGRQRGFDVGGEGRHGTIILEHAF